VEYPKRAGSEEEFLVCTELLPSVRERYGPTFVLLEIPEVLRATRSDRTIYFRHYGEQRYNDKWNEREGGSLLGTELSSEMVQLLKDLQTIDVDWLLSQHHVGQTVRQSAFDLPAWLQSFRGREVEAIAIGLRSTELSQGEELVRVGFQSTSRIVSNGDFYPRNRVRVPNRMVLVDWGYWPGHRACFVDYLVNVAAFAFIHMWGNCPWQKEFVRHFRETFDIELDDLRKAILVKSFEQALFFQTYRRPDLVSPQVNHFRLVLRNELFS
jgi:hypothetical protein